MNSGFTLIAYNLDIDGSDTPGSNKCGKDKLWLLACEEEYQRGLLRSGGEAEESIPPSPGLEVLKRGPFISVLTSSAFCILSIADVAIEIHMEELKGSSRHLLHRIICKHTFKNFMLLMIPLMSCLLRQQRIFNKLEISLYPTPSSDEIIGIQDQM